MLLEDKGPRALDLHLSIDAPPHIGTCLGIHFGSGDDWTTSESDVLFLLVVQERIGFGAIKTTTEDYKADNPSIVNSLPIVSAAGLPLPKAGKEKAGISDSLDILRRPQILSLLFSVLCLLL